MSNGIYFLGTFVKVHLCERLKAKQISCFFVSVKVMLLIYERTIFLPDVFEHYLMFFEKMALKSDCLRTYY